MLLHLPTIITIGIDIAAWFIIHIGVSYMATRIPLHSFNPNSWLYRRRSWEKNGKTYDKLFKLKQWKNRLPDGAVIFKSGFEKKHLKEKSEEYYSNFIRETCRAEITHWIVFLFGFTFFIWNIWWVGIVMIVYASAVNIPCIITQRYNRIRLKRIVG